MSFTDVLTRIFFPEKCPFCKEIIPLTLKECECCGKENKVIKRKFCEHCGADEEKCTCQAENESFLNHIAGVYYYTGKVKAQFGLYKFSGKKSFAKEFSLSMSERVAEVYSTVHFDAVTFVPSSEKSMKERGFNQSELLAKGVSKSLFIPLQSTLIKTRETELQHELSAKERVRNLDGAFAVKNESEIKGRTFLLCDDIKTTGTTLKRCCDVLMENGAKDVYCIVLAVTDYMTDF